MGGWLGGGCRGELAREQVSRPHRCWAVREQARSYRAATYPGVSLSARISPRWISRTRSAPTGVVPALQDFQRNIRTHRSAPSGGRVESEFQGLSGMDGPSTRAPETPMERGNFSPKRKTGCRGKTFGYFLGGGHPSFEKVTRPRGRNKSSQHMPKRRRYTQIQKRRITLDALCALRRAKASRTESAPTGRKGAAWRIRE